MMKNIYILLLILLPTFPAAAQPADLKNRIEQLLANRKATVGVSITHLERGESILINNNRHYPMQSVFKFHLALAVLDQVDQGKLKLEQKIFIKKSDLLPDTWSPIREAYPNGNIDLPLSEVIKFTVAQSDNNGCDILFRLIGGPKVVDRYIHKLGIKEVSIQANEQEMHASYSVQFSNWTTPKAATDLLIKFYQQKVLSPKIFNFLLETMLSTSTGLQQLKEQLPVGTAIAHKTGNSGTNPQGVTAALNDIGIITLPDGNHIAISVFVSNSTEDKATNEKIISDIARAAWDYFSK